VLRTLYRTGQRSLPAKPPIRFIRRVWRSLVIQGGEIDRKAYGVEGEDMIGITAAIGVVAAGRDLALMVEQPVEHIRGFARGRRDQNRLAEGETQRSVARSSPTRNWRRSGRGLPTSGRSCGTTR
jgi:hypothetical protein